MSNTVKLVPEPNCECFKHPEARDLMTRNAFVASNMVADMCMEICKELSICREGAILVMHEAIIGMATALATCHAPAIESGSQEARWETEALLRGIEARLMESIRHKYETMAAMTQEERDEAIRSRELLRRGGAR